MHHIAELSGLLKISLKDHWSKMLVRNLKVASAANAGDTPTCIMV